MTHSYMLSELHAITHSYMLSLQDQTRFEGNDDENRGTIWSCAASPWNPLQKGRPKFQPDWVIHPNCGGVCIYASCKWTSNIKELLPPTSITNTFSFRSTLADYICSSSHLIILILSLQSELLYYIHKRSWVIYETQSAQISQKHDEQYKE